MCNNVPTILFNRKNWDPCLYMPPVIIIISITLPRVSISLQFVGLSNFLLMKVGWVGDVDLIQLVFGLLEFIYIYKAPYNSLPGRCVRLNSGSIKSRCS